MEYTTIKIPVSTHKMIANLANLSKTSKQDILIQSLKDLETKLFWEECKRKYELNAINSLANEDDNLLDNTLMDGLEDEY